MVTQEHGGALQAEALKVMLCQQSQLCKEILQKLESCGKSKDLTPSNI